MTLDILRNFIQSSHINFLYGSGVSRPYLGAPDKPCGVGRADANPKLLLNDT